MSFLAISRPSLAARSSPLTTIFALILVLCSVSPNWAFPDQFELNSFLYNAPPKSFEADFFNPRMKLQNDHPFKYSDLSEEPRSSVVGVLKSQNRKYLAKTPAHDHHFQTILRQQEAATIKDPGQAAMVANDQMELQERGVRNSLQTSDDDVYEVESAPVMKSTPYRMRGEHYGQQHEPSDENTELPVSVNFESNIDHSYEPQMHQKRGPPSEYAKLMEQDGEPAEPPFHKPQHGSYGRQYNPPMSQADAQKMHFSMGGITDDDEASHYKPRHGRGHRGPHHTSFQAPHHAPFSQIHYSQMPASDNYQPEHKPRHFQSHSDEFRSPNWGPSPALHEQSRAAHEREIFGSPPEANSKHTPMESSWLDMGAYSSGNGAYGWYSDIPVSGERSQMHKK